MTSRHWQRLQELFDEIMQQPLAERERALQRLEETVDDPTILRELKRLVQHAETDSGFLEPVVARGEFSQTLRPGDVIAERFEIFQRIGRGGMGEVFEAFDRKLGERVAIKMIASEYARDPKLLERFQQEVQIARRVSHPNVCRIHDLGEHKGVPYLSMELLEGETVAKRLERGPLSLEEWQVFALQLFDGLRAAHAVGIIHRDLKPSNLMLVGSRLVILDFGLATPILNSDPAGLTQTGTLIGTLDWMAPEQLLGEYDERSDLYSAALVLLHALAPRDAKTHGAGLAGALRRAISDTDFQSSVPKRLPRQWRYALLSCLERDPAKRPARSQSVQDLVARKRGPRFRLFPASIRRSTLEAAAVLAIVLALVILGFRYLRQKEFRAGSLIMIASTVNETGEGRFDGVTPLLRADLEQSSHFNVWNNQRLGDVLRQMRKDPQSNPTAKEWREVAFRESAPLLVFTTLGRLGDSYTVSIRCEQIGSSPEQPIDNWQHQESSSGPDGLFEAVHEATKWIRTKAGESEVELSANNRLPQNITSSKWDALELFQQAQSLIAAQQAPDAVPVLQRAVQLDPQFAMALMWLGDLVYAQNRKEEGLEYWRQAISLAATQHLSEHERLSIESRYALEIEDFKKAEPILRDWAGKFPHDPLAAELLAFCLLEMGRYEDGVGVALAAQANSQPRVFGTSMLIRGLAATNRTAEIEPYLKVLDDLNSQEAAQELRGIVRALQGRYDESAALFRELILSSDRTNSSRASSLLANLEADRGRFDEARQVLREGIERDRKTGQDGAASRKTLALASLEGVTGSRKLAATLAREAASGQSSALEIVEAVSLLAQYGDISDATRVMNTLPSGEGPRFEADRLRMRGEILAAAGKPGQALELLDRAANMERPLDPKEYLARVLDLAGDHERARRIYQRISDSPWLIWSHFDRVWPGSRFLAKQYLDGLKGRTE
ncbi:MAG: serine/threonine protein kinase [Bryobacterales bacterium]|nr:serine/threonine protein kinase [Bryobacterales bacterium]